MKKSTPSSEEKLIITRVFDAPRELVFECWTDPAHIVNWWGPAHFTCPYAAADPRPGGEFHFCMRLQDGQDFWSKGKYLEVVRPERIVSTMYFSDAEGRRLKPADYGLSPEVPEEMLDTVRFEALEDGRTRLTLERDTPLALSKKVGEDEGWRQSLDKFSAEVARAAEAQRGA